MKGIQKVKQIMIETYERSIMKNRVSKEDFEAMLEKITEKHFENYLKAFGNVNHNEETFANKMLQRINDILINKGV